MDLVQGFVGKMVLGDPPSVSDSGHKNSLINLKTLLNFLLEKICTNFGHTASLQNPQLRGGRLIPFSPQFLPGRDSFFFAFVGKTVLEDPPPFLILAIKIHL